MSDDGGTVGDGTFDPDGMLTVDPVTGEQLTYPTEEWLNEHAIWPYAAGAFHIDTWYEVHDSAEAAAVPDAIPDSFGTRHMVGLRFRSGHGDQHVMLLPAGQARELAALIVFMAREGC